MISSWSSNQPFRLVLWLLSGRNTIMTTLFFSLEFLRESKVLYDNFYSSYIIVGTDVQNVDWLRRPIYLPGCYRRESSRRISILLSWNLLKRRRGVLCQYIPYSAGQLFQRVGYLCGDEGTRYTSDY